MSSMQEQRDAKQGDSLTRQTTPTQSQATKAANTSTLEANVEALTQGIGSLLRTDPASLAQRCLAKAEAEPYKTLRAEHLYAAARHYYNAAMYRECEEVCQRGIELETYVGRQFEEQRAMCWVHTDPPRAIEFYEKVVENSLLTHDEILIIEYAKTLANLYHAVGRAEDSNDAAVLYLTKFLRRDHFDFVRNLVDFVGRLPGVSVEEKAHRLYRIASHFVHVDNGPLRLRPATLAVLGYLASLPAEELFGVGGPFAGVNAEECKMPRNLPTCERVPHQLREPLGKMVQFFNGESRGQLTMDDSFGWFIVASLCGVKKPLFDSFRTDPYLGMFLDCLADKRANFDTTNLC